MPSLSKYPKIAIRSKNDLAKRISSKKLPVPEALALINDVLLNYDKYWYDNKKKSEPDKNKFVRSAVGSPLGKLLKLVDKNVLAVHDGLVPVFIFGGVSKKNHVLAAANLIGGKSRTFYKVDLHRFFEQVDKAKIYGFYYSKCGCSKIGANLLARICSVPEGPKGNLGPRLVLARGFSTSPRLALWCNLDTFNLLNMKLHRLLNRSDYRLSIYVDDIGITARVISIDLMNKALALTKSSLEKGNLSINDAKTITPIPISGRAEYVGIKLGRRKLTIGRKSQSRLRRVKAQYKSGRGKNGNVKNTLRGMHTYSGYVSSQRKVR